MNVLWWHYDPHEKMLKPNRSVLNNATYTYAVYADSAGHS